MLVLGLDLETTGLDVGTSEIIEIGAVLWDCERKTPLKLMSELVSCSVALPPEIVRLTGIKDEDLQRWGQPLGQMLQRLHDISLDAEYIVAHNGSQFDRLFLERDWIKHPECRIQKEWIDTLTDLPFSAQIGTRKLTYLAAEHGFLNPFSHRAVFDVLSMLKVFSNYSIEEIQKLQNSPLRRLVAQVSYEGRDQAKTEGFRWDPKQRHWYLEAKECQLESRQFPFPVIWL
ncbi:MAG: exonuclease domain-containing protein [Bdellovibrionales bacterium]